MKVSSIFNSIDGEVNWWGQGTPTTFIRLSGCNLRCSYCDTPWARNSFTGEFYTETDILKQVGEMGCPKITITGGEPLVQGEEVGSLLRALLDGGVQKVSVETNGSFPPVLRSRYISWVMDYKLPSSGEMGKMVPLDVFFSLGHQDFIKMVITDLQDYEVARGLARQFRGKTPARVALSIGYRPGGSFAISPQELLEWMRADELLDCVVNLQLHKLVGLVEDSGSRDTSDTVIKNVKKKVKK